MAIPIVSLEPVGHYYGGAPMYEFHTSYPSTAVRALDTGHETAQAAYDEAVQYIRDYEQRSWPGGMGEALGATQKRDGLYYGVINTYYSNS